MAEPQRQFRDIPFRDLLRIAKAEGYYGVHQALYEKPPYLSLTVRGQMPDGETETGEPTPKEPAKFVPTPEFMRAYREHYGTDDGGIWLYDAKNLADSFERRPSLAPVPESNPTGDHADNINEVNNGLGIGPNSSNSDGGRIRPATRGERIANNIINGRRL